MSARPVYLLAGVLLLASTTVRAESGRTYHNDALRVRAFELPHGWEIAAQAVYPRILLVATNPDGARLTLAVQHVPPGTSAIGLAADARAVLARQRFDPPRLTPDREGGVRIDSMLGQGRLRQVYLVDGDLAFVLTLFSPPGRVARALKDFDEAVETLEITPATEAPPVGP